MSYQIDVEYTDTFGGESNYSWVRRVTLDIGDNVSKLAVVRRAKAAVGINGLRGQMHNYGDMWEFRPYHTCTVMFINVRY